MSAKAPLLREGSESKEHHSHRESMAEAEHDRERMLIEKTNPETGLSESEVVLKRREWGFNALPEKKVNPFLQFLGYFWGPMPIMIWLAIIVEAIPKNGKTDWEDFGVLMFLQLVNGTVGYIEERNAGNAIDALKQSLAPQCRVCRGGVWQDLPSKELVPGDLIELVIGDIVPADAILRGSQPMQVDQSALTGESLPVTIHPDGKLKMGSAIKRGEGPCIVCATGANTFFGKAAGLIDQVEATGRFQKILFKITLVLLGLSLVLCAIIFISLVLNNEDALQALGVVIVLLVASIPIAMQVVCTSTMAVGSRRLAQKKVIVARLSAIEELAGMTILCSDKTGTLTQNKLSLREPLLMGDMNEEELIFYSALSAKRAEGNQDAIDFCITQAVRNKSKLREFKEVHFVPFNPTDKRTESTVEAPDGSIFKVTKGAPQVILGLAHNQDEIRGRVDGAVQSLADRGFRALGVAISYTGEDEAPHWQFQGVLALFDPPRHDTKETIEAALQMGVEVKMITGDQTAIAKETCRELGMGTNILDTTVLDDPALLGADLNDIIMNSNGFAEVLPEHKFQVVQVIREVGHVTGMTGDGVNDAPALKRADIGIAVEGATDAAKAAADIVLVEPGLSVIIDAIRRSRKIFQRMRNYCIYRIACTIQLLFFFFFTVLAIHPNTISPADFCPPAEGNVAPVCHKSFTLPVIALVVITILNDGTIITIAHDKVIPDRRPQKWDLPIVVTAATVLGLTACLSSVLLLVAGLSLGESKNSQAWYAKLLAAQCKPDNKDDCFMEYGEIQTMMYLKISLSDFLTVFAARTRGLFFERRPGYALSIAFVFATACSTILSLVIEPGGDNSMIHISGSTAFATWVYCLIWFVIQDLCKVMTYFLLSLWFHDDQEKRLAETARRKEATNAIETDRRASRARGISTADVTGGRPRRASSVTGMAAGDMEAVRMKIAALEREMQRVNRLETELEDLRTLVSSYHPASE